MAIITLSREMGSGGSQIIQMIRNTLNYKVVDKSVIEDVLDQYGLIAFDEVYRSTHSIWSRFDTETTELIQQLNRTILAFAAHDQTLIVGRGGFVVLRDYENVLNVLIRAPFEWRVNHAVEMERIDNEQDAEQIIRQNDRVRENFLQTFYHVTPDCPRHFNLIIDTSRIPMHMAANWIIEAARDLDRQEVPTERHTSSLEVDPVLAQTVSDMLAKL